VTLNDLAKYSINIITVGTTQAHVGQEQTPVNRMWHARYGFWRSKL